MQKKCSRCGKDTEIVLRNVVYRNRVKILNVPVHVCVDDRCAHTQVVDVVKEDLKKLMDDLGQNPQRQAIVFEEVSEVSYVLASAVHQREDAAVQKALEERVNELLDLFLLAQSLGDEKWMSELRQRLTKVMVSR
jgi:cell division FtsZ-interacting protein ZapD